MAEYWRLIFQMAWDEDAAERARREEAAEHGGQDVLQRIRLKIEWTRVCLPARERTAPCKQYLGRGRSRRADDGKSEADRLQLCLTYRSLPPGALNPMGMAPTSARRRQAHWRQAQWWHEQLRGHRTSHHYGSNAAGMREAAAEAVAAAAQVAKTSIYRILLIVMGMAPNT